MLFVISLCALSALESTSGAFKNIIQLHYDAALTRRKCSTMLSIVMRIVLSPFASSPASTSAFSPTFSDLSSTEKFKFQSYIKCIKQEARQAGRTPTVPKAQSSRTGGEVVGVVYYKSLDGRPEKGKLSMCRRSSPVGGIIYSTRFRLELWAAVIKMLNALTPTKARTLAHTLPTQPLKLQLQLQLHCSLWGKAKSVAYSPAPRNGNWSSNNSAQWNEHEKSTDWYF